MTYKATVTITVNDEVNVTLHGVSPIHNKILVQKYGKFVPGYKHTPPFKLGRWDGRIKYYRENDTTFLYLLEEIVPQLDTWGYEIKLKDKREGVPPAPDLIDDQVFAHINHPDTGQPIVLRPHQVRVVNALIECGFGLGVAATSAGKTFICAALSQAYESVDIGSIIIVPDGQLVRQTHKDYVLMGLDVGMLDGTNKDTDHMHLITTWQSLKNQPKLLRRFGMMIVDECHKAKSKILNELLVDHGAHIAYRFGVTGTLPEHEVDQMAVLVALGPVREEIPASELIEKGVLAELDIDVIQLTEDAFLQRRYAEYKQELKELNKPIVQLTYALFKKKYFPDYAAEKKFLTKQPQRIEWIAKRIQDFRTQPKDNNILVLASSIEQARAISKLVPNSHVVNGLDTKKIKDRQKIYDLFATEDGVVVIATVHIASTGLSINRIFKVMLVDVGKSFTRVIQSIGRGLRVATDKDYVAIDDVCSDLKYSHDHMLKRLKYYADAKYPHTKRIVDHASP